VEARDGRTVSLESLRGKAVLLDFRASWCEPCKHSFPWLEAMLRKHAADSLIVLAVSLDKTRDQAEKFLSRYPATFTVAFDRAGKSAEAFKVEAMPSTYSISAGGSILYAKRGFDPKKTGEIEAEIRRACARGDGR